MRRDSCHSRQPQENTEGGSDQVCSVEPPTFSLKQAAVVAERKVCKTAGCQDAADGASQRASSNIALSALGQEGQEAARFKQPPCTEGVPGKRLGMKAAVPEQPWASQWAFSAISRPLGDAGRRLRSL
uniref:Uncharacterized protein n=1 Tax=Sphaerodactylus townsendi TaxID=933632 RepID=A0ACB8G1G1_9SAUR